MKLNFQKICALCGPLSLFLFFVGFAMAGFFPPTLPTATAAEIAAFYQQNASAVRLGGFFMVLSGAFSAPFAAAVSDQMSRMQGPQAAVLSKTQLALGATGIMMFLIEAMFWSIASFRPDRPPEITLLLSDIAWFWTVMPFSLIFLQNLAIGSSILADRSATPVFPRWLAFFNFWAAILYVPGGLCVFFKTGPFAWNGLFAFWVPATFYFLWFCTMSAQTIKAAQRQAAQAG